MRNDFASVVLSRPNSIDTIEVSQVNAVPVSYEKLVASFFDGTMVGGCNSKSNRWLLAVCPALLAESAKSSTVRNAIFVFSATNTRYSLMRHRCDDSRVLAYVRPVN